MARKPADPKAPKPAPAKKPRKPEFSPTRIRTFLSCPMMYRLDYVEKVGRFYHRARAGFYRVAEDPYLLFNAAVVSAFVLMTPAGGQYGALWMHGEKILNRRDALLRRGQIIQPEFKKRFSRFLLAPRMVE